MASRRPRQKTQDEMQQQCDDFNARIAIGEEVSVLNDFGEVFTDHTTSDAQILSGHTPVVGLKTKGVYALDRVRKKA